MDALHRGHLEGLKGGVHATIAVLLGVSAFYNVAAFTDRKDREWHLLINVLIQSGMAAWEARSAAEHWRR